MSDWQQRQGVLQQTLGDELIIFDPLTDRAHALDPLAAQVWQALARPADVAELVLRTGLTADQVVIALLQLDELTLLVEPPDSEARLRRRDALRRAGLVIAAGVVAPVITTLAVPAATAAASGKPLNRVYFDSDCPPPPGVKTRSDDNNGWYGFEKGYYACVGDSGGQLGFFNDGGQNLGGGYPVSTANGGRSHKNTQCQQNAVGGGEGSGEPDGYFKSVACLSWAPQSAELCARFGSPAVCTSNVSSQ
jgi:hypothetical protein